jgi:uncharacterized membrane protein YkvA (DUF1232 family)
VIVPCGALVLYLLAIGLLVAAGRRGRARDVARFVPDCAVLFKRLLGDARLPWWCRALVAAAIAYLLLPVDLVPDFVPVAGQLDDAILVALVLRVVLRAGDGELLRDHWPGPPGSRRMVARLAGV